MTRSANASPSTLNTKSVPSLPSAGFVSRTAALVPDRISSYPANSPVKTATSSPAPPSSTSSPAPPINTSLPSPPYSPSSAAPPWRQSSPPPPQRRTPVVPLVCSTSSPDPPKASSACTAASSSVTHAGSSATLVSVP